MQKLPHKTPASFGQKGFTLIELLIVIVIIGILSGVLISVVNPVKQQQKANETVMRSNLDKIRMAFMACVNSREDPYNYCDSFAEIGVNDPVGKPKSTTTYPIYRGSSVYVWLDARMNAGDIDSECRMRYRYDTRDGKIDEAYTNGMCVIDFSL